MSAYAARVRMAGEMVGTTDDSVLQPDAAADLIHAVALRAFHTWEMCLAVATGGDENAVLVQTHYHVAEQLDAIAVLVRAGAVEPSKLQLRAAFEALLTLEYITQADTRRRAYAWLIVADVLERIKTWKRLDPLTDEGRQFAELQQKEGHRFPVFEGAAERRSKLQSMLENDPRWTEAYEEYRRAKKAAGKRSVEWFELFGGPQGGGVRALALHLGHGTHYEILYRTWSRRMHGTDAVQRIKPGSGGTVLIEPPRYASDLEMVLNFSIAFGMKAMRLLVEHYSPEEWPKLAAWYVQNVSGKWLQSPIADTIAPTVSGTAPAGD